MTKTNICKYKGGKKINYLIIPKDIIYDLELEKNRVMLFSYFATRRSLDDTVGFSNNNLISWCGYKVNYHKDKTNDQFQSLVCLLSQKNYIEVEFDIIEGRNTYNLSQINQDKFDVSQQFALIYFDEIEKDKNFNKYTQDINKMNASILLLVLSYIRLNMLRRHERFIGKQSDKPEFCYRMYIDIEKDIGLSSRYISRAVKIIEEIGLISTLTLPRYKDDSGNWHTEVTLFADRYKRTDNGDSIDATYDFKQELQWGVEYITNKKYLR